MAACARCGQENPVGFGFCGRCGARLTANVEQRRKPATLLFCDAAGSTAMGERLDAEAVRELMFGYFHEMRSAIERHGGTVEKFVGDAVMAVFGVPEAHEDDPMRACRAAFEMQQRMPVLNEELKRRFGSTLTLRIGINSGEVVAGDSSTRETFVSGDAVNVAARLEQAARPGEILLGERTYELVKGIVEAEPVSPIKAKGKSVPVVAHRLISTPLTPVPRRRLATPLVGRESELATLKAVYEDALGASTAQLAVVVGEAGVGKSRLAEEFLRAIATGARVLSGRCLPYGEGITYWPLTEVVRQAAAIHDWHDQGEARARLLRLARDERVADLLAQALGLTESAASPHEIAWAARRLLEAIAAARPLVLFLDDLQWGEQAMLDLVAGIAERGVGKIMLLCLARPEFAAWEATLRLAPLSDDDAAELARQLGAEQLDRIVSAAGGNPLFLEELAALLAEDGLSGGEIPPTLDALLAARLDQLPAAERMAAELASVEGQVFHRGAVIALMAPGARAEVPGALANLEARELILAASADFVDEAAYRFRHLLIRDAAYAALAKRARAELHERLADWLEEKTGHRSAEYDEIIGYHLEQAYRYRTELGPADAQARLLAERAAERLAAAGHRASLRWDLRPAIGLLERAGSLFGKDDPRRLQLLPELGSALIHAQELLRAEAVLHEAIRAANEAGDSRTEGHALLALLDVQNRRHADGTTPNLAEEVRRVIRTFEEVGDLRGLAQAWLLLSGDHRNRFEMIAGQEALARALAFASKAGDPEEEAFIRIHYALALLAGPVPLVEVSRYQQVNLKWARANRSLHVEAASLVLGGRLQAMRGAFEEARALVAQGRALFEDLGIKMALLAVSVWSAEVEELASDLVAAEREFRVALKVSEETGDWRRLWLPFALAWLADRQGRHDEAEKLVSVELEEAASDERGPRIDWCCWRARTLARRGKAEEAVRLVEEAIALAPPPDAVLARGDTFMDAAEALALAGRFEQAAPIVTEALQLYERKGHLVMAERARARLAELQAPA